MAIQPLDVDYLLSEQIAKSRNYRYPSELPVFEKTILVVAASKGTKMDQNQEDKMEPKVAREPNGRPFLITMGIAALIIVIIGITAQVLQTLH